MTNANDPAYPTIEHGYDVVGTPCARTEPGLTKLEIIATAAMKGMLNHGAMTAHGNQSLDPATIARLAVNQAKALITELNKQQ